MSRRFTPKVITANRLREGDVVYLTADDRWSLTHAEAELIDDEAHAQLAACCDGPAVILLGLAPRRAVSLVSELQEALS